MNADAASATQPAMRLETALSGRSLHLARAGWVALVALALAIFAIALWARFTQIADPAPDSEITLQNLGLSLSFYAAYLTAVSAAFGLGCFAVATLIVRGKSDNPMALFVSLFLVLIGVANAPNMQALSELSPRLELPVNLIQLGTWSGIIFFLLLFPNGRFIPRWTRPLAVLWVAGLGSSMAITGDSLNNPQSLAAGLLILGGLLTGTGVQIYRYIRVSSRTQRQQTRWVVFGLVTAIGIQVVTVMLEPLFPDSNRAVALYYLINVSVVTLGYFFIPLTIGIAILRSRLWDIDVVVNRAIVYGLLTATVAGVYVLAIGGIGALFQSRGNLGVSLLAAGVVAVLFQPLRERFQHAVNRLIYGERDEPYAVLSRLGKRLEDSLSPDAVLPAVVLTVREALRLPYAAISLRQDDEFTVVAESGAPAQRLQRVPLVYQGTTAGELLLGFQPGEDTFGDADMRLFNDLARQAGIAAHGVRLTADLQRSRERLVNAREEERRRLRRDLHDGLGPQLASQALTIDAAIRLLEHDPQAASELLRELKTQSQEAVADIRRLVYALRPPALDDLGLAGALQAQADAYRHTGLEISIAAPQTLPSLPAAVEVACYRIVQEALTNTVRHARAQHCDIALSVADSTLHLEIHDDGRGLPNGHRSGVGFHSMHERAAELGGEVRIESSPAGGTCVNALLPLPMEER